MSFSAETMRNFSFKRIKFEHNVGEKDQKIRYGLGAVFIFISLFLGNILLLVLGVVSIISAYLTWCPAYSGWGMNSCSSDADETVNTKH